ncbi:MAG: YfhO family protein [Muribaculaceae bacterium]|nr:YfhO family protein [Muribaculaceae bacterium]
MNKLKKSTLYSCIAALLLALVALLFFAPDDIEGNVLQQHDIMQGLANGQETQQYEAATGHAPRWTNSLFSGMPTFQISPSYSANSLMGWIFKVYTLGLPSPANLLFAMMVGFFIMALCMKFKWPTALFAALAWGFSTYFIIIIGAGHIWKFLTLAYIPPTIGGLALIFRKKYLGGTALTALSAALQLQSNHPQMTYYFLFPILFLVIARGISAWRLSEMPAWWKGLGCAFAAAILALGANSASLYNSYEYSKETIRGRATDLVDPNAPKSAGADHDYITAWSYGIDETWSLLIPNVKGGATIKPEGGQNQLLSVADASDAYLSPEETQFLQQFPQYFGDQPMTNGPVYVGALVLLLAILAMFVVDGKVLGPLKWALFASIIFSIFLSWGHNFAALTDFFIDHFPGYNKFRTPSSILVVTEFCLPLLAAMAIAKMVETPDFIARYKWTLYTVFGVGAAVCFLGWVSPSVFGQPYSATELSQLREMGILNDPAYANIFAAVSKTRLSLVSADSARSLMYIIVGFLVICLYLRGAFRQSTIFVCALTAIMVIDLFSVNKRYVNSDNFVEPLPAAESFAQTEADRQILQDTTYYRVIDLADNGGARSSYFHHTVGGYHAAKLTRYNDLLTHIIEPASRNLQAQASTNYQRLMDLAADSTREIHPDSMRIFTADVPVLDMLNTKYYMMGDYAEENPNALGNAWFVGHIDYVNNANAEMQALATINPASTAVADAQFKSILGQATAVAPGDTIALTSYAPDRLGYRARSAKGGIAVFSEIWFPWGWEATIDGSPAEIGRVDYTLRALRIPAGEHEIIMTFNPRSLDVTNTIGVISVILIFLLCLFALGFRITFFYCKITPTQKGDANKAEGGGSANS